LYTEPFTLTTDTTVRARAFKDGYNDSPEASATFQKTTPPPLEVVAGGSPAEGEAPLEVQFWSRVWGGVGPDYTYLWDFGDGNTSPQPNPAHTYLTPSAYSVEVTVTDSAGASASYGPFEVGPRPAGPTDLAHTATAVDSITWTWTDNSSDEDGFRGRDETDTLKWTEAADATQHTETGLSANTQYSRYVRAYNIHGESAPSNTHAAYTSIETPTGVSFGTVTNQSIALNATGTLSNLAAGNSGVYFDETGGNNTGINVWIQTTTDTATSLSPNTQYTFQVKARNGDADETAYSPISQKHTLASQPGAEALANISASSIQANWNAGSPANPAGTTYLVECYEGLGFGGPKVGDSGEITTLSHTFGTLDPNAQYSFRVRAKNGDGVWTDWTDLGSAYTKPNSPGALTIEMQVMDGASLKLTAPGCRSLSIVSIGLNGNPPGTLIAIKVQSGGWLRFDEFDPVGHPKEYDVRADGAAEEWHTAAEWAGKRIRGLAPGTSYTFEAKAKNDDTAPLESDLADIGTYSTNKDGDVNRNGSTSILDLIFVRGAVLTGGQLGLHQSWATDVDDSRQVDISDMNPIRLIILSGSY